MSIKVGLYVDFCQFAFFRVRHRLIRLPSPATVPSRATLAPRLGPLCRYPAGVSRTSRRHPVDETHADLPVLLPGSSRTRTMTRMASPYPLMDPTLAQTSTWTSPTSPSSTFQDESLASEPRPSFRRFSDQRDSHGSPHDQRCTESGPRQGSCSLFRVGADGCAARTRRRGTRTRG